MTKANKTVIIIFAHAYIRIDQKQEAYGSQVHVENWPIMSLT